MKTRCAGWKGMRLSRNVCLQEKTPEMVTVPKVVYVGAAEKWGI